MQFPSTTSSFMLLLRCSKNYKKIGKAVIALVEKSSFFLVEKMATGKYFGWQIQDELQYWLFSIDSRKSLSPISHYILLHLLYLKNYLYQSRSCTFMVW